MWFIGCFKFQAVHIFEILAKLLAKMDVNGKRSANELLLWRGGNFLGEILECIFRRACFFFPRIYLTLFHLFSALLLIFVRAGKHAICMLLHDGVWHMSPWVLNWSISSPQIWKSVLIKYVELYFVAAYAPRHWMSLSSFSALTLLPCISRVCEKMMDTMLRSISSVWCIVHDIFWHWFDDTHETCLFEFTAAIYRK